MAEYIREIYVEVVVDTNKRTIRERRDLDEITAASAGAAARAAAIEIRDVALGLDDD